VEVDHPGDEGALQVRASAAKDVKPGARQLRASLEVDDAQRFTDLPVRLRLKVERRRLA
jgi:hypothetical protein